jgi:hypothetical protein
VRENDLDYIEVASPEQLVEALHRLARDPDLYQRMVEHGRRRAAAFSDNALRCAWQHLLGHEIGERLTEWQSGTRLSRMVDNLRGILAYFSDLQSWRTPLSFFNTRSFE